MTTAQAARLNGAGNGMEALRWRTLGNSGFRRLWAAGWLSALGSQIGRVGLILYIFRERGSISGLALLVVLETLPGLLASPLAGVVADRASKRRILIGADLLRALFAGVVLTHPAVGTIYAAAALQSIATAFFQPARSAALPRLVAERELPEANALEQGASNLVLILGPVLGATLLLRLGLRATLVADALSFLASAALLARLDLGPAGGETASGSALTDAREGWRYLAGHPLVSQMAILFFVSLLCTGLWMPLAPFFLCDTLGLSEGLIGWQIGTFGLGSTAGALAAPCLVARLGKGRTLFIALLGEGAVMTAYSRASSLAEATVSMLLWGVAVSMIMVPFYSILQTVVDGPLLGRVFSIVKQFEDGALMAAMGIAAVLQGHLSTAEIFLAAGLLYVVFTASSPLTRGGRALLVTR